MMDGFKLVSTVRNDARHKGIPIVVVTTEGGEEDRARAMQLGASAYLPKPVQAAHITDAAKKLLKL